MPYLAYVMLLNPTAFDFDSDTMKRNSKQVVLSTQAKEVADFEGSPSLFRANRGVFATSYI